MIRLRRQRAQRSPQPDEGGLFDRMKSPVERGGDLQDELLDLLLRTIGQFLNRRSRRKRRGTFRSLKTGRNGNRDSVNSVPLLLKIAGSFGSYPPEALPHPRRVPIRNPLPIQKGVSP